MSTLITNTIQGVTTIKKDASTTNATLNANGTITPGNTPKLSSEWNSSFGVGVFNNDYSTFSSLLIASDATYIQTSLYLINPRTVMIGWYFYKNSHVSMNAQYGWGIRLPTNIIPVGGPAFSYQAIPSNYFSFNGTNYFNATPHRWQANTNNSGNNHNVLSLYGAQASTNWSSGTFETSATGILMLSSDITTAYA